MSVVLFSESGSYEGELDEVYADHNPSGKAPLVYASFPEHDGWADLGDVMFPCAVSKIGTKVRLRYTLSIEEVE